MIDVTAKERSDNTTLFNPLLGKSRLGECEVCGEVSAKYTCPACEVKTCSLPCVRIHKKELDCSGIRNRIKFKQVRHFTDLDLQSDYVLLEELGRSVERVAKARRPFQKNLAFKWQMLKNHLLSKGTYLYYLPPKFRKHINNTSYLFWKIGVVYWKVEWLFPQSAGLNQPIVDNRVEETSLVSELLDKLLHPSWPDQVTEQNDCFKPYVDAGGKAAVKVLMKVEKTPGPDKFLLMSPSLSLAENLQGKIIIEHPTFHVVLTSHICRYEVVPPESVVVPQVLPQTGMRRKWPMRRGERGQGETRRNQANGSIKFFSDNLGGSCSDSD